MSEISFVYLYSKCTDFMNTASIDRFFLNIVKNVFEV